MIQQRLGSDGQLSDNIHSRSEYFTAMTVNNLVPTTLNELVDLLNAIV